MNPIPQSFPSPVPRAREVPPDPSVDQAEKARQFEQLLDGNPSQVRPHDHFPSTEASAKEVTSADEAGKAESSEETTPVQENADGLNLETTDEAVSIAEVASGRICSSHGKTKQTEGPDSRTETDPPAQDGSDIETTASAEIASAKEAGSDRKTSFGKELKGSKSSPGITENARTSDGIDSVVVEGDGKFTVAVHARKKKDHKGDDSSGDASPYRSGIPLPVNQASVLPVSETAVTSGTEAVGKIEQIAALIAQTAQQVTFQGNDSVRISLSPEQLPDSKLIIQMTQQVVQVTFLSDNASSLSLLQSRGGEVAASLALRFDREIRIEVKAGGEGSDAGDSEAVLASWAVQGNSRSGSASANA